MSTSTTTPGQQQTNQNPQVPRASSRFNTSYQNLGTHRFGEYTPHFVAEGLANDRRFRFRCAHNIRTYTLKSPLLSDLVTRKDYFMVPLQAIIPFNWDKFVKNPKLGDDIPADAGLFIPVFMTKVYSGLSSLLVDLQNSLASLDGRTIFIAYLRMLAYAEWLLSNGSLLASLGCHLGNYIHWFAQYLSGKSTDDLVDAFFAQVVQNYPDPSSYFDYKRSADEIYRVYISIPEDVDLNSSYIRPITLRDFWYMFLDQPDITDTQIIDTYGVLSWMENIILEELPSYRLLDIEASEYPLGLDLRRVYAYNLVVAHYYSNDNIDYIYSADLYRQLIGSYAYALSNAYDTFVYNGVTTQYDYLSCHYVSQFIEKADLAALSCIFNFHRSLKYIDYFTGCRARPLAVGNTDVLVNAGTVSVVNITQNIQKQRFLNAVNRAKSTVEGYIEDIFGVKPAYDFHNPAFLASTKDDVRGVENENTGNQQFELQSSITSVMRSNAEKFMFETSFDRPVVVIGITYYDIPRIYADSIDRQMMYKDRFDDFIPEMQFVGDEKLLQAELRPILTRDPMEEFGYQGRYNEMKMRFNTCFGGFSSLALRSWAFVNTLTSELNPTVSPDFIRSRQSDLDRYYLSLSGFSYSSYFHFIVVNTNYLEIDRPLVKKPQIL